VLLSITACVISKRFVAVLSVKPTDNRVFFHSACGMDRTATFLLSNVENAFATSSELYFCGPVSSYTSLLFGEVLVIILAIKYAKSVGECISIFKSSGKKVGNTPY